MIGLNNVMRATGYPKKAMLTSMVTVLGNIYPGSYLYILF